MRQALDQTLAAALDEHPEEPMRRQVSYKWRLREVMAAHGMFTISDLVPLLTDRDINLSVSQVHRLATGTPERLSLPVLAPAAVRAWLRDTLVGIDEHDHRQLVERFATWHVLRRLRRFADRGPVTEKQTQQVGRGGGGLRHTQCPGHGLRPGRRDRQWRDRYAEQSDPGGRLKPGRGRAELRCSARPWG
jgi:hypothetical protein